jgi:anti-sigma B factor antagonist
MTLPGGSDGVTIERHGEVTVFSFAPPLDNIEAGVVEDVACLLNGCLGEASAPPLVVVDLSALDYFGSSFLGLLLRTWKQVTSKGGQLVLCGVSSRARDLLHITSLDMVWALYPTRREAIAALELD